MNGGDASHSTTCPPFSASPAQARNHRVLIYVSPRQRAPRMRKTWLPHSSGGQPAASSGGGPDPGTARVRIGQQAGVVLRTVMVQRRRTGSSQQRQRCTAARAPEHARARGAGSPVRGTRRPTAACGGAPTVRPAPELRLACDRASRPTRRASLRRSPVNGSPRTYCATCVPERTRAWSYPTPSTRTSRAIACSARSDLRRRKSGTVRSGLSAARSEASDGVRPRSAPRGGPGRPPVCARTESLPTRAHVCSSRITPTPTGWPCEPYGHRNPRRQVVAGAAHRQVPDGAGPALTGGEGEERDDGDPGALSARPSHAAEPAGGQAEQAEGPAVDPRGGREGCHRRAAHRHGQGAPGMRMWRRADAAVCSAADFARREFAQT